MAPTEIAALPLKGKTIHSFFVWSHSPLGEHLSELLKKISATPRKYMQKVQVLVIEEISMVSSLVLDRMDQVLRAVMENELPFCGKQVMFTGDFHQLSVSSEQVVSQVFQRILISALARSTLYTLCHMLLRFSKIRPVQMQQLQRRVLL